MNRIITTTLLGLGATALLSPLPAQELKIATVSMQGLYEGYYKTQDALKKFKTSMDNSNAEAERMRSEGQKMLEEFQALAGDANDAALTEERRQQAEADARLKQQEVRKKEADLRAFLKNTQEAMRQTQQSHRALMIDEIRHEVMKAAKARNANLVLDTSGGFAPGVPTILYADPSWDITQKVLEVLNADAPK